MKNSLFILFIFLNYWSIEAQYFTTLNSDLNISPTTENNIVNVNMKTYTYTNSELINVEHSITGNTITMNVCYYLTGFQFANSYDHTFPVTIPADDNYTIIINLYSSQTQTTCDFTELTDTASLPFTTPLTETVYLGVENFESLEKQINVYPNPVKDFLNIIFSNNITVNSLDIYNILGAKIKTATSNFESLDVSDFSNGMYFLTFNTNKGVLQKKVLVKN